MAKFNKKYHTKMQVESSSIFDKLSSIDVFNLIESWETAVFVDFSDEEKKEYEYNTGYDDIYYLKEDIPLYQSLETYAESELEFTHKKQKMCNKNSLILHSGYLYW